MTWVYNLLYDAVYSSILYNLANFVNATICTKLFDIILLLKILVYIIVYFLSEVMIVNFYLILVSMKLATT